MASGRTVDHASDEGSPKGVSMRVLLISANREDVDIRVPALGLACIAAATENAGHSTLLLDLMTGADPQAAVAEAIDRLSPDVIGISVRNIDDQRMQNTRFLLDQAKQAVTWCRRLTSAPIVLGGAGFSILPGPILEYLGADMGIQGEGESTFPELLKRLQEGGTIDDLPGVYQRSRATTSRRIFSRALDLFPLPDPSLMVRSLSGAKNAPVPVQTRRGCPLMCSYCSTPTIEGKLVRWRSPESVVDWMSRWVAEGFRNFYFVDNTFNLPPSYAMRLCTKLIAAGLDVSWRCILFPGGIDEQLIETFSRAGCQEVSLGFESGVENMLFRMKKQFALADVRHAAGLLRHYGIRTMGFLLLGGPGETRESVAESLAFAESLGLDAMKLSIGIRIYPHTELARVAKQEGLIPSEEDLLLPKFYLARDLEKWLYETTTGYLLKNPNWSF
jgi:radical SAM superfamily enzyme YgiQ (UPF0313 family)